jgi:hypothetical protein
MTGRLRHRQEARVSLYHRKFAVGSLDKALDEAQDNG